MTLPPEAATELALELEQAERNRVGVPLLTDRFADFSWSDARVIAQARDELRLSAGDRPIGYKLGWTSAAMREALGIQQPNWGTLWASQVRTDVIELDQLIHPKVEPELVFVAGADLRAGASIDDVMAGCAGWMLGLEVVDPRFPSFDFRWLDNTADNSSAARVVMSERFELDDPASVEIAFTGGEEERVGVGANAMGSPLVAVQWLVERLGSEGSMLPAGSIVFTGGLAAPFDLGPGHTFSVTTTDGRPVVRSTAL